MSTVHVQLKISCNTFPCLQRKHVCSEMNNVENNYNIFFPVTEEIRCIFKTGSLIINFAILRIKEENEQQ